MPAGGNQPLDADDIGAFESRFGVAIPVEYREFLLREGNGGPFGPRYGLLRLGTVPSYWSEIHDYSARLRRPFPLEHAWVWEDEPDAPDLERRIDATEVGVLLLGEEGCGARWVLVVSGMRAGEVWLTTGEGAAPTGLTFGRWLERFASEGDQWWIPLVENWGPSPYIWFAAHAIKQRYVSTLNEKGAPPAEIAQSCPICFDCIEFLVRDCVHYGVGLEVTTPDTVWVFSADGTAKTRNRIKST